MQSGRIAVYLVTVLVVLACLARCDASPLENIQIEGCSYNGVSYKEGDKWPDHEFPAGCVTCECWGGGRYGCGFNVKPFEDIPDYCWHK